MASFFCYVAASGKWDLSGLLRLCFVDRDSYGIWANLNSRRLIKLTMATFGRRNHSWFGVFSWH